MGALATGFAHGLATDDWWLPRLPTGFLGAGGWRRKLARLANNGVRRRLATTDVRAVPPSRGSRAFWTGGV